MPANPRRSSRSRKVGGEFFAAPDSAGLSRVYKELGSRLGTRKEDGRSPTCSPRSRRPLVLIGGHDLGLSLQEASREAAQSVVHGAVAVVAAALAAAAPAGAANECDGLQVCVPVAGPWVVVPASTGAARSRVEYQLTCPRGHIVGGLDARLSVRGIDVVLPRHGSGARSIRESRRRARRCSSGPTSGRSDRAPTFRPFIGCMPAAGGGARSHVGRRGPGSPVTRRVAPCGSPRGDDRGPALRRGRAARRRLPRVRVRDPNAAEREPRLERVGVQQTGRKRRRPRPRRRRARGRARSRPGPCALLGVGMSNARLWLALRGTAFPRAPFFLKRGEPPGSPRPSPLIDRRSVDELQEPVAAPRPPRPRLSRSACGSSRSAAGRATRFATRTSTCSRPSPRGARGCATSRPRLVVLGLAC